MPLIRDASRRSGITPENAYNAYELTGQNGPSGDVWIRNRLVDGQVGAPAASDSERNDGQIGNFPLNTHRWVVWYERFTEMPTTSADRWQVVGPEIHGPNQNPPFPQALLMLEVGPDKRRRLNANAGRSTVRYRDIGSIVLNQVYAMRMHVYLSAGSDGIIEIWRDGAKIDLSGGTRVDKALVGATINTAIAGSYWKEANYRAAGINGPMTHEFSSLRIFDTDPGDLTGGGGGTPPPPGDTAKPTIVVAQPMAAQSYPLSAIPYDFVVTDADAAVKSWVGVGGRQAASKAFTGPGHYTGIIDAAAAGVPPGNYTLYVDALDAAGNKAEAWTGTTILTAPPPPDPDPDPPPDPEDPYATVNAMLAVVDAKLATVQTKTDEAHAAATEARSAIDAWSPPAP
jgi:hypothetical protein